MPLDPHQWQARDFVTATLLDGDCYLYQGQQFTPNGIRFHAKRPVYKGYNGRSTNPNSLGSGAWGLAYGDGTNSNPSSAVIVDTPGQWGGWFDPNQTGNVKLNKLSMGGGSAGGGGLAQVNGGLGLVTAYALWPQASGTGALGVGIGDPANSTSSPDAQGSFSPANSAHQTCCVCIDLMDMNTSNRWANLAFNGTGGSLAPVGTVNADGSGWSSRTLAHWASVYPLYGHTVSSLPAPVQNWTGSSPVLTASLLNGNTGLRDVFRFLNMPPVCRAEATGTQSLTSGVAATVSLNKTSGMDSYSAFNNSTNTYTAPFTGLYFVHGYCAITNIGAPFRAGVQINGTTTYWGPWTASASSFRQGATKTQIFSLNAGDTIVLRAQANAAATTSGIALARLVVTFIGQTGLALPSTGAIDTSFRWAAGTPGPVTSLFNTHLAADLNTLTAARPYLLTWQNTPQAVSMSTPTAMSMDTVTGQVHGDAGDLYGGWNSSTNTYTAQVAGWYMAVEEVTLAQPTLTTSPSVLALLQLNPHGTDTWDRYQQQSCTTSTGGSGATAVSYYYLRVGDTIGPGIEAFDASSTTLNTGSSTQSHFELVWLGEG